MTQEAIEVDRRSKEVTISDGTGCRVTLTFEMVAAINGAVALSLFKRGPTK